MKLLNNFFLIEKDFCSTVVIQGLVLNGAYLSGTQLMESKRIWKDVYISNVILKFQNIGLIYCKIVKNELFTIEITSITFKDVGFFVGSI